jgi:hypothetical protein
MEELSHGGCSIGENTSSASTRPSASRSGTRSTGSGRIAARIWSLASFTLTGILRRRHCRSCVDASRAAIASCTRSTARVGTVQLLDRKLKMSMC